MIGKEWKLIYRDLNFFKEFLGSLKLLTKIWLGSHAPPQRLFKEYLLSPPYVLVVVLLSPSFQLTFC